MTDVRPGPATPDAGGEKLDFLAPPQAPGELGRLGPYRVLKVLGAGGMGLVLQAEDPTLKRLLALKVMRPEVAAKPEARQRFLREAQATAAVEHPYIIHIHQIGEDRGVPYLAMPFLKGEPLDARLKRELRLPLAEALRIARQVAEGLAAAHAQTLIHRDIKPGNIWLEEQTGFVKVLDFGLARAVSDDTHLTQAGTLVGTPAFMAPEQASPGPVDHRCDLFSLGVVLYRMLGGHLPFKGNSTMALLRALAVDDPTPLREVRPDVPDAVAALVMQLLARDPARRPQSAAVVATALGALVLQFKTGQPGDRQRLEPMLPVAAESVASAAALSELPAIDAPTPKKPRIRGLALAALVAVAVVGALIGVAFFGRSAVDTKKEPSLSSAVRLPLERFQAKLKAGKPVTLVAFGDSMLASNKQSNWAVLVKQRLQEKYKSQVTLDDRSVSGSQLQPTLELIPGWLAKTPEVDLATFCFGYNDWASGVRREDFRRSCREAVDRIRKVTNGKADVLIVTTLPSVPRWTTMAELAETAREVAREKNVGLADGEKAMLEAGRDNKENLFDKSRVHLSPSGEDVVAQAVLKAIEAGGR